MSWTTWKAGQNLIILSPSPVAANQIKTVTCNSNLRFKFISSDTTPFSFTGLISRLETPSKTRSKIRKTPYLKSSKRCVLTISKQTCCCSNLKNRKRKVWNIYLNQQKICIFRYKKPACTTSWKHILVSCYTFFNCYNLLHCKMLTIYSPRYQHIILTLGEVNLQPCLGVWRKSHLKKHLWK